MIIFASGRCDVVAFAMPWFLNRIQAGFVDVRNPYYPDQVSRISLAPEKVDALFFCTKNPLPLLQAESALRPYCLMIQVTVTPYERKIEPNVPDKRKVLAAIVQLAERYGPSAVQIRYDPILISKEITEQYHAMMFERLCAAIEGKITTIIFSFVDRMKNTRANEKKLQMIELDEAGMKRIAQSLSLIASRYGITLKTCAEAIDLSEFGILNEPCFGPKELLALTGRVPSIKKGRRRQHCGCLAMADIGAYNCCRHFCQYCYANYAQNQVDRNWQTHDPNSTMILGRLQPTDQLRERKR